MEELKGLLVKSIDEGSIAEEAGFQVDDLITKYEKASICDRTDFTNAIRKAKSANKRDVTLEVNRKGDLLSINVPLQPLGVTLKELNSKDELRYAAREAQDSMDSAMYLGVFAWIILILGSVGSVFLFLQIGRVPSPVFPHRPVLNEFGVFASLALFVNSIMWFLIMHVLARTGTEVMNIKSMIRKLK